MREWKTTTCSVDRMIFLLLLWVFLYAEGHGQTLEAYLRTNFKINKPTLFVVIQEDECITCLRKIGMFRSCLDSNLFDMRLVLFSRNGIDKYQLIGVLGMPVTIVRDPFLYRFFNTHRSPLIFTVNNHYELTAYRLWQGGFRDLTLSVYFYRHYMGT